MKSKIFDKNGIEVKEGDKITFPYVTPFGDLTEDEGFSKIVVFKYGCFGYETSTGFETLFSWMKTEQGVYVPNCGNKKIYTEKYPFWVSENEL